MTTKEEQIFLGQKRPAEVPLNSNESEKVLNDKDDNAKSTTKKCSKCTSEIDVITITSIEEALNFLKENVKIKEDSKKIEQSLIPYKLLQDVDVCKKCLLDKCSPPNEIKNYFKMIQIIKSDKSNQCLTKELKANNVIQVSLKLSSNKPNNDNKPLNNTSSTPNQLIKESPLSSNDQEKETKTVQPIFTTIMQFKNQSQTMSSNNNQLPVNQDNQPNARAVPMNIPPHFNQLQTQQSLFKNTEMNSNLYTNAMPELNPMQQYPDYQSPYQPFEKKKSSAETEIKERNLELINQALDELKEQIGTMKYCNQLQKNSLSSLFNYMEFFNDQFKTNSYYQNNSNNPFQMQQPLFYNNNSQQNMMDYFPKQMPINIPLGLNPEQISSLFHSKIPNPSFQNQNHRGPLNK